MSGIPGLIPDYERDARKPLRRVSMSPQEVRDQVTDVVSAMSRMRAITDAELQNIRRIFEENDQDNSDSIDLEELKKVMEALGSAPSEEQLRELVEQVTLEEDACESLRFPDFLKLILLYKEAVQYSFLETESGTATRSQQSIGQSEKRRLGIPGLQLPDSRYRVFIDVVIAIFSMYIMGSACLAAVRPKEGLDARAVTDICVATFVFLVDIFCSAITCVVIPETGELVDGPGRTLTIYAKGMLAVDLVSLVPWELWPDLRLLRLVKLVKVFRSHLPVRVPSGRVRMDEQYVWIHYTFLYQFRLVYLFILFTHICACIFAWLQQDQMRGDYSYDQALYWVLYTMSTVGYGDIDVTSMEQRIFADCLFVCSLLFNGFVVAEVGAFLNRTDVEVEQRGKMRETVAALRAFGVPQAFRSEILAFQWHQLSSNISRQNTELLQGLPEQMQNSLELYVRMRIIQIVPLFRKAHPGCRIALAQSLTSVVASPEEYIIVLGEIGNEMYFLGHGYVDVIRSDGIVLATLPPGAFFGEIALLTNLGGQTGGPRTASIKALSYCDLFKLDRYDFFNILQRFPRFRESIGQEMRASQRTQAKVDLSIPHKPRSSLDRIESFTTQRIQPQSPDMFMGGHQAPLTSGEDSMETFKQTTSSESVAVGAGLGLTVPTEGSNASPQATAALKINLRSPLRMSGSVTFEADQSDSKRIVSASEDSSKTKPPSEEPSGGNELGISIMSDRDDKGTKTGESKVPEPSLTSSVCVDPAFSIDTAISRIAQRPLRDRRVEMEAPVPPLPDRRTKFPPTVGKVDNHLPLSSWDCMSPRAARVPPGLPRADRDAQSSQNGMSSPRAPVRRVFSGKDLRRNSANSACSAAEAAVEAYSTTTRFTGTGHIGLLPGNRRDIMKNKLTLVGVPAEAARGIGRRDSSGCSPPSPSSHRGSRRESVSDTAAWILHELDFKLRPLAEGIQQIQTRLERMERYASDGGSFVKGAQTLATPKSNDLCSPRSRTPPGEGLPVSPKHVRGEHVRSVSHPRALGSLVGVGGAHNPLDPAPKSGFLPPGKSRSVSGNTESASLVLPPADTRGVE
eukprot:Hpha_TRINITY_DN14545_c0_g1::TRINITY_DN14545_c0_g1_i2::g.47297::m.47297/K04905/KCNH2; potassium voltage-gated channel Eag-related subfamily H member 2